MISLVSISPSDVTSWCVSTYLSHLDRTFSSGLTTWMAFGMTGCRTVPRSMLEGGLWSTHFSPPALRERRWRGRTGVDVCRTRRRKVNTSGLEVPRFHLLCHRGEHSYVRAGGRGRPIASSALWKEPSAARDGVGGRGGSGPCSLSQWPSAASASHPSPGACFASPSA